MFQCEQFNSCFRSTFLEFVEVVVQNILYAHKIYPNGIFKLMKKYGVPVHVSQHPDINSYITECMNTADALLLVEKCRQINVCFHDNNSELVEKFIFHLPGLKWSTFNSLDLDPCMNELNQSLRLLLLKIVSYPNFKQLPQGSTFLIQIETTEHSMSSLNNKSNFQHFPWVQTEEKCINKQILPVCNAQLPMNLEILIEETVRNN